MINYLGLAASLVVLGSYGLSVRRSNPRLFHWGNAIGWLPVALPALLAGIWGAALLSISFGVIGTYALFREKLPTTPTAPHHGGTPTEMLRDLADFLDALDDAGKNMIIHSPGHPVDGMTLDEVLNYGGNEREMQSDVRWLADQLETT
jgi:hypothetical protein